MISNQPDESQFRHPWERPAFIASVVLNLTLMVGAILLANAGADWLDAHPFLHKHIKEIRVLAIAAVFVLPTVVFIRRTRMASILGNSVLLSPQQLPEIHSILEEHCRKLGISQVPELFLTDKAVSPPSQAFSTWNRDCIALNARFIERKPEKSRDVLSFMLGREIGRIRLGHTKPLYEVMLVYMSKIPYLRNPLTQVETLSLDRYGAYLEPNAIPGLMILACGRRLVGLIRVSAYLENVDTYRGFWPMVSNLYRPEPHISFRIRELRKAGLLQFDAIAYEANLERERLKQEEKDQRKKDKRKAKDKDKIDKDKVDDIEQSRRMTMP